jgi:hypothetical protein
MKSKIILAAAAIGAICFGAARASALIMTGEGNTPVTDAGWPEGTLALANLKTRAGWIEGPPFGGGQWTFFYRGNNAAFDEALTNFAAIQARTLELVIHEGPAPESQHFSDKRPADWTFTVWVPAHWHQLYNNPKSTFGAGSPNFRKPVDPPRLDVYAGPGGLDWSKVAVPSNVHVTDERAAGAAPGQVGGALIRVQAFDMANGKPIHGAKVIVASMSGGPQGVTSKPALRANGANDYVTVAESVTDDAGRAEVAKIPGGPHRVSIEAAGYGTRVLAYESFREHSFKTYSTDLSKAVAVRGRALDSDGNPIPGVKVRADNTVGIDGRGYTLPVTPQTTTDAAGGFMIEGLPAGYCQFWASADGYSYGDVTTVYEAPVDSVTLTLKRAGAINVRVNDKQGGALARFENNELMVFVEPKGGSKVGSWGGGATVKSDGTVEFRDVPAGEYRITSRPNPANTNKEYTKEQIVVVKPGTMTEVRIVYQ